MAEFPHPDQIQYGVKQAEQGKRYQFYAGACYLLHAKTAAMQGATGLTVKFFTSEDPDSLLADQLKAVLAAPDERDKDAPDIYFPHGIYIEVDGVSGNTDVALVEADWVPREAYCRAYPDQTRELIECWSKSAGRDAERWLENFDPGDPDSGEWDNEGAAGTGGVSGAFLALDGSTIMTGDVVLTESADHSETPAAGFGQFWVRNDSPCVPMFTDDAGTDTVLGAGGGGSDISVLSVKKGGAGTINAGEVVYASGYSSGVQVELADGTDGAAQPPIGVALEAITESVAGKIALGGVVSNFDTSGFTAGDNVYLSETAGALVNPRPAQDRAWRIGTVLYSHATLGILAVNVEEVQGIFYYTQNSQAPQTNTATRLAFVAPIAGTFHRAYYTGVSSSSSGVGTKYWDIMLKNYTNGSVDLLAAAYNTDTDGDPVAYTPLDLGAPHGTAANLVIALNDVLSLVWTANAVPPSLFSSVQSRCTVGIIPDN